MHPLLTFASGLVAGIVGIRLLKGVTTPEGLRTATSAIGEKARHGVDAAQTGLRDAAVSGLAAIEKSSASLRGKLVPTAAEAAPPEPVPTPEDAAVPVAPAKAAKPRHPRKASPRKAKAASPPAPDGGAAS